MHSLNHHVILQMYDNANMHFNFLGCLVKMGEGLLLSLTQKSINIYKNKDIDSS